MFNQRLEKVVKKKFTVNRINNNFSFSFCFLVWKILVEIQKYIRIKIVDYVFFFSLQIKKPIEEFLP